MKAIVVLAGAGLGLLGLGTWWATRPPHAPVAAVVVPAAPAADPDSLLVTAAGVVGAGDPLPLLAHVSGRVRKVYFAGGEYVRRGDVLAKLYDYTCVVAPRDGFLGARQVAPGQFLSPATPVTTLSRYRTLVVALPARVRHPRGVRPGDSVRVWVASRPARVVAGVVGPAGVANAPLEILLGAGAPFHLGELACVQRLAAPR